MYSKEVTAMIKSSVLSELTNLAKKTNNTSYVKCKMNQNE